MLLLLPALSGATAAEPCTFVANLHVRKCGGTTVRKLFQQDVASQGWEQAVRTAAPRRSDRVDVPAGIDVDAGVHGEV